MIIKTKKVLAVIVIFMFLLPTVSFASSYYKTLEAWFGEINIVSNNQAVATDVQPFIVDGTTYVSVRTMANMFNKEIAWNGDTHTITITDKPNTELTSLQQQLANKDFEISQLKAKVSALELHLEDDDDLDMDDLEDNLNDDYDEYKDVEFEITLSGDEDDITVKIYVDLDDFDDEWDDLTTSNKKSYIQDIVDDILDEYDDADIEGYIKDDSSSSSSKLLTFTVSSSGKVSIDEDDDLSDLEDDLDSTYDGYFDDIDLSVELDGDEDDVTFYVYIDMDDYEDEWEDLSDTEIRKMMSNIYDDIEDEYDDADIEGYIYDEDNDGTKLAKYTESSSGSYTFKRYE